MISAPEGRRPAPASFPTSGRGSVSKSGPDGERVGRGRPAARRSLLEFVVGEGLDPRHKDWTPAEPGSDLGIGGPVVPPAEQSSLQRAQPIVRDHPGTRRPGKPGHGGDPTDHLWAAPETTGDLDIADAFLDQTQHQALDRPQAWTRRHDRVPIWVAAQTPWILVKPMWQWAQ